jgi:hypothetical protein
MTLFPRGKKFGSQTVGAVFPTTGKNELIHNVREFLPYA